MPTAEVVQQFQGFDLKIPDLKLAQQGSVPAAQHVNHYGIEVMDSVIWQNWEPGKEYTKHIVLKNVQVKTKKIKYRAPTSRFFTTLFPKAITLSAGTSFSLPVTFRPLEKNTYEDKVEFKTQEGLFEVPVKAVLPHTDISLTKSLDFEMCAANDFREIKFEVSNAGDTATTLQWECCDPFSVEPTSALLEKNGVCKFKATFRPLLAIKYEVRAVCRFGHEGIFSKTLSLTGVGKFPHLLVSMPGCPANTANMDNLELLLHFNKTPVGSMVRKFVELHNLSPVRVPFKVEHPTGISRIDTVFHCPQREGVVPPMSALKLPLTYSPNTVDTTTIDYFNVTAVGNVSKSVIKCEGSSKGPSVQLSTNVLNFQLVDIGETGTNTLDIINNSDVPAVFQFQIDCEQSVFKMNHISGTLAANSKQTIILTFQPQHPLNYRRRLTCLVHNQEPLFLDLLGTCHSETVKPAIIKKKHLERYKRHVARGLSIISPEQLNELYREGKLTADEIGALKVVKMPEVAVFNPSSQMPFAAQSKEDAEEFPPVPPLDEYFNDGHHTDIMSVIPHVSLDVQMADFGNQQNLRVIEDKPVCITNHTRGKVTVQWVTNDDNVFSVFPPVMDIPPLKSCSFRVAFKPTTPNHFYGAELECYVYYKSLRDHRLVEDSSHCPPWCLTIQCLGNTFVSNNETFLPRYSLDSAKVVFPAVNAKESTYRTMLVSRQGSTPILYDLEKDDSATYQIKPAKGLLKNQHQIFVIKITPAEVKTYKKNIIMRLNNNDRYNQELQLFGSAESADVLLDNDGRMFFKPTCVGTASTRPYIIKNISRIPLRFEWKLNHADAKLLRVSPDSGIIQPNEALAQTWSFIPSGQDKFVMKPNLIVFGQGFSSSSSGGKKQLYFVRGIGEGSLGEIKVEQSYFDFGDIVVGTSASKPITLYNNGSCSLHYKLHVTQTIDDPYPEESKQNKLALELDIAEGVLTARSKQIVMVTVRPVLRVSYQFAISYQLQTPEGEVVYPAVQDPQHLCHVLTTGVFPVMAVSDARCYGSAAGISKKQLWNLFSLDNLNTCLESDPSEDELMYSVATRHSHRRRPPVYTRAIMDFNFSAAPLDSDPCVVSLMFENTGTVPTEWMFLFPYDLQLELDYWMETGEFDEDELHEMKVMDNKLFTIEPKKGKLMPGECQTVTFTYKHTMAGTDRLPVLLKLSRGREILLNFIGVTVEPDRHYIHFPANKHMFTPVAVGEKISPKQVYELFNGGGLPVQYMFDLTPLDIIRQENYDQPIFECLNPSGEVGPGRTATIEWRFSPLEAKTYMVDVPIRVHNGDTAVVTFTGVGYDKRIMGKTMPVTDQPDTAGVPSVQSVDIPGQLAYLSRERISLGNMPIFSRVRRMVFLMNKSKERPISYEWHVTTQSDSQVLKVSPVHGYLEPGESQMCRVSFLAFGVPAFYDLDLICEVTDEHEKKLYEQKLQEWEDERERQKHEFTITENDLDADKRIPNAVEILDRPPSRLKSLDEMKPFDPESGELSRYKTLPPIQHLTVDEQKEKAWRERWKYKDLWEKPMPPPPFLLHLGLTGRTHDVHEFQLAFPEEYRTYFIDRGLSEYQTDHKDRDEQTLDSIVCSQAESNVISGTLCNILRGLLDDTHFHEAVKKITKEPIPYFRQFGERPTSALETGEASLADASFPLEEMMSASECATPASDTSREKIPQTTSSASVHSQEKEFNDAPSSASVRSTAPNLLELQVQQQADQQKEKQSIKKLPEAGNVIESTLENTILNVMSEALAGEFSITARSRFIALPKRPQSNSSRLLPKD